MNTFFYRLKNFIENEKPFIILFIGILLYHIFSLKPTGDDIWMKKGNPIWQIDKNFIDATRVLYFNWSGRIVSHWITYFFTSYYFCWLLLDSIIWVLFIRYTSLLTRFFENNSGEMNKFICIFFFVIYPWKDMGTAGNITTTIFYLWPYTGLVYICYLLTMVYVYKKKMNIIEYIFAGIALLFVISFEQTIIFSTIISFLAIVHAKKSNNRIILSSIIFIISILGIIFIFTCPGNFNRYFLEIGSWYPDYQMLSFLDKINLGLTATMYHFIKVPQAMVSYLLFIVGMIIFVLIRYPNKKFYFSILIVEFLFIIIALNIDVSLPYVPGLENFEMINGETISHLSAYLPVVISLLLFLWPVIGLYIIYQENLKKGSILIILYLLGFIIRFMMGFSPTIYASNTRTYISAFFVLILINSILYIKIFKSLKIIK